MNRERILSFARFVSLLAIAVACVATTPRISPADEAVQLTGEVVDLSCYLHKGSKGSGHRACAKMCAKKGLPIGLLTESGELYLLIENHDDPEPYEELKKVAGSNAQVSGEKYSRDGMTAIQVKEAKGL